MRLHHQYLSALARHRPSKLTTSTAGLSRRSSMSALNASPRQAIGPPPLRAEALMSAHHLVGSRVIDLTSRADQLGSLRRGRDDEPGVNGDAVATHTGPGRQDVDPRVPVGQPMISQTSSPSCSQTPASSLAKAMLTSRKEFSTSLAISALSASVKRISPRQNSA